MGLLRKAGLAVPGQQEEAAEEPSHREGGGLLYRSLAARQTTVPRPTPDPHAAQITADILLNTASPQAPAETAPAPSPVALVAASSATDILSRLRALPDTVELPSLIFGVLKDTLAISRGALLLYDPMRMVYAPWASCGLDQTTLHRLRISLGAVGSFTALANGRPVIVEAGPSLAEYQRYFSSRELASVSRFALAPFIADEKLIGALLVLEAAPPFDEPARLLACLEEVCGTASPAIHRARSETMRPLPAVPGRPGATLEEGISRLVSSSQAGTCRYLCFSVSLDTWQRRILEANRYLDPFRLGEDLRYFLGAFAADLGAAFPLPGGVFLFALQGIEPGSLDLLVHQLRTYLSTLFGASNGKGTEIPVLRSRMYPDDGTDVAGLLSFFTS